jgi:hypothetical protein
MDGFILLVGCVIIVVEGIDGMLLHSIKRIGWSGGGRMIRPFLPWPHPMDAGRMKFADSVP